MTDNTVQKMHLVCPHCNATNRLPSDKLQAELNCGQFHASLLGPLHGAMPATDVARWLSAALFRTSTDPQPMKGKS